MAVYFIVYQRGCGRIGKLILNNLKEIFNIQLNDFERFYDFCWSAVF